MTTAKPTSKAKPKQLISGTRAFKNARAISRRATKVLPAGTQPPDVLGTVPLNVLLSIHGSDKPETLVSDPQLKKVLSGMIFPAAYPGIAVNHCMGLERRNATPAAVDRSLRSRRA